MNRKYEILATACFVLLGLLAIIRDEIESVYLRNAIVFVGIVLLILGAFLINKASSNTNIK